MNAVVAAVTFSELARMACQSRFVGGILQAGSWVITVVENVMLRPWEEIGESV